MYRGAQRGVEHVHVLLLLRLAGLCGTGRNKIERRQIKLANDHGRGTDVPSWGQRTWSPSHATGSLRTHNTGVSQPAIDENGPSQRPGRSAFMNEMEVPVQFEAETSSRYVPRPGNHASRSYLASRQVSTTAAAIRWNQNNDDSLLGGRVVEHARNDVDHAVRQTQLQHARNAAPGSE